MFASSFASAAIKYCNSLFAAGSPGADSGWSREFCGGSIPARALPKSNERRTISVAIGRLSSKNSKSAGSVPIRWAVGRWRYQSMVSAMNVSTCCSEGKGFDGAAIESFVRTDDAKRPAAISVPLLYKIHPLLRTNDQLPKCVWWCAI